MPTGPVLEGVLARAADPDEWERFERQLRSTGYCRRPVPLRGGVDSIDLKTGEVRTVFTTEREPDETLLKCCGNRREAVCPSCAGSIAAMRSSSWPRGCVAARVCPRRWRGIRWCS